MASQKPVKIDAKSLENAENTWQSFMAISKYSTYGVCLLLFILWLWLVGF